MTSRFAADSDGCLTSHLASIAPNAKVEVLPVLSNDAIGGRETVSSMAKRTNALLVVNGSYFHTTGEILGLMKLSGAIISTSQDGVRSAVGRSAGGKYLFGRVDYEGIVALPNGLKVAVSGVNCERGEDMCVIYRPSFGARTGTNPYGKEYIIQEGRVTAITDGNSPLAADTIVLSVHGKAQEAFAKLCVGDAVKLDETLTGEWNRAEWIVGAGPTLVTGGKVHITAQEEVFGTDVAGGRAPRTAIGITKDGTLLVAVIEGRHQTSRGATLTELGEWMKAHGAVEAINLDGGGSSVLWADGKCISRPSDGQERQVGNAIGIFAQK